MLNVYIAKKDFSNILIIGKLSAGLKNGKEVLSEFVARIVFVGLKSRPKVSLYEVWAASS